MKKIVFLWFLRVVPAVILFQTLFFKFSAAPESVELFKQLNLEPYGRIGSGVAELIAVILILIPRFSHFGALLSIGVISGAIISHLTVLGINVNGDGGLLFTLACIVFACNLIYIILSYKNFLVGKKS